MYKITPATDNYSFRITVADETYIQFHLKDGKITTSGNADMDEAAKVFFAILERHFSLEPDLYNVAQALLVKNEQRNSEIAGHPVESDEFDHMVAWENARTAIDVIKESYVRRTDY